MFFSGLFSVKKSFWEDYKKYLVCRIQLSLKQIIEIDKDSDFIIQNAENCESSGYTYICESKSYTVTALAIAVCSKLSDNKKKISIFCDEDKITDISAVFKELNVDKIPFSDSDIISTQDKNKKVLLCIYERCINLKH